VHVAPFISSAVNLPSRALTANSLISSEIWNADRKSIFQISDEINELAVKARDGKLTADEMKGATCMLILVLQQFLHL
jgi:pyruvate dehydrogenase E2 component (dihydrolipoamide acetyltransferase)